MSSEEFDEANEPQQLTKMKTAEVIKRIMKYLKPHKFLFVLGIFFYVIMAALGAVEPLIQGEVVTLVADKTTVYSQIVVYASLYAGCVLAISVIEYFADYSIQVMSQNIIYDLRADVFAHIENLSIDQIHSVPIGKWVTRVTNDTNSLMTFFSNVLVSIIYNALYLIAVIIAIFIKQWQLAFVLVAFLPVIIVVSFLFANYSHKYYRLVRSNISAMNGFLSENLSGMDTIQVFNQEERKADEFNKINCNLKSANYKAANTFAIFRPIIYFLYSLAVLCVFAYGLRLVDAKVMLIGDLYAFYIFTERFFFPVQNIANQFNSIQSALAGAERVLIVLDTKLEICDSPEAKPINKIKGKIEFSHVYFAYKENDWILKDVSFVINPGDTVAFVGETGAGKSTIINLMVRNFDIQKGRILIDDIDIKNITISSLRKNVGEMLQDVFLFSGTVKSNISLGDPSITDEQIKKAAEYVGADGFISKLPHGYDEPVMENGNNFSQGQRQLISFARVVTYSPSLIVLDEATANIDTETEVIIQNSLEKIKTIGTMVMVAHRLSTIRHATMIYVVDHGIIVEQGNHQALLKKRGLYYNLYKLQSMETMLQQSASKN